MVATLTMPGQAVALAGVAAHTPTHRSSVLGARVSAAPARSARAVALQASRPARLNANRLSVVAAVATEPKASSSASKEQLRFLTPKLARQVKAEVGTPAYVYDLATLQEAAAAAMAFPNQYGLTARYAMKSSPNAAILKVFDKAGLHIDASSGYEVRRAIAAGIAPEKISLSSQELPEFFPELVDQGMKVNACSISQLKRFGEAFPGGEVGLRINPGLGSGGTFKTNVGGPASSFGIWHELIPEAKEIVAQYNLKVVRIHTHIGSGSDPAVWQKTSGMSIDICREFPDVTTLNLGGGYKVGRMSYEKSTDLQVVGTPVKDQFKEFAEETGRELHLEIEPGTFLLANSCSLVCTVQDIATTGEDGYVFPKLDAGMTEVLRPSLYGAQHPLVTVPAEEGAGEGREDGRYVVVGHCCESGDLMTPAPDEPETLAERTLAGLEIGDLLVVEGSGAYCSSMSTKNYNSFPEAPEVLLGAGGEVHVIRKKQTLEQIYENEVELPDSAL